MKYAIISDIHGNLDALQAVLKDSENHNVDKYIFVGDYCSCFPYPNEIVETIRNIHDSIIVKGNQEDYLAVFAKQDQGTWIDGQLQVLYWFYWNLANKNHIYFSTLPKIISFNDGETNVTVTHKSSDLYGDIEYKEFGSGAVAKKYQNGFTSRDAILQDIQEYVRTNEGYKAAIEPLTDGVYIFGHTHIQWHAQHKNKIFINPGSCGIPADGTWDAPYTLLNIDNNQIHITERRVQYDIGKLRTDLKNSDVYKADPVWIGIALESIDAKFLRFNPFLRFVESYANEINDHMRPFSVKTWTKAFELWQAKA